MGHPLEVLGVGDQPLVHALLVTGPAGLDRLDVGVDLLLLAGEVLHLDPRVTQLHLEPLAGLPQLGDLGELRQVLALVAEPVGPGVELLDLEQRQLGGRVGFQRRLLGSDEPG